jgi:predicted ATPase
MISKQHHSLTQLQIELRSQGHSHSQQTILEEYIAPMIEVGLVQENQNPYTLTLLGSKINELVKDFHELEHALPAHSECYEEKVLDVLLEGSKTSEEIRNVIEQIIAADIAENQFDECDGLTFKALKLAAANFYEKLTSIYHQRVAYPGFDFRKTHNGDHDHP